MRNTVLNAANFGVPQIRERFFLVGLRDGRRFTFPSPTHRNPSATDLFSVQLPPWQTAGDVILDLDTGDELPGHRAGGNTTNYYGRFLPATTTYSLPKNVGTQSHNSAGGLDTGPSY